VGVTICLALRWHFTFDILEVFTTVSVEVGVAEGPALRVRSFDLILVGGWESVPVHQTVDLRNF